MRCKTYFNLDRLKENLYSSLKDLMFSENADTAYIPEDDKFYLKKTKYRIEIRDHNQESKIWWTYVMYNDIPFDTYANRLFAKYIALIDKSNVNDFHGNVA